jgi:hypothetical protein
MDVEKTLRGSRRLEPLHIAFSSPHDLMGVLSAIVFSEASIWRRYEIKAMAHDKLPIAVARSSFL